ncbi:MAG: DUF4159 domain-containing protein [Acidobacteria bacterium]|nr:MAG: DUF4159 domain-containing protein [Acidobacteriota bacterium]
MMRRERKIIASMGAMALLLIMGTARGQGDRAVDTTRFTFARIKYSGPLVGRATLFGQGLPPWAHDYPRGGRHLMKIVSELTSIETNPDEVILTFDDPHLFEYPFAYLCEVGFMQLSDAEIKGLREYLLRGGFLIVDDFRGRWALNNLREHLRRAFPEYELEELDISHPIFNCFFTIETLDVVPPYGGGIPKFYGLSDEHGRLMMVVNYNNDISEYWEWSDDPFFPIEETNQAYKFGVNYIIYALTH